MLSPLARGSTRSREVLPRAPFLRVLPEDGKRVEPDRWMHEVEPRASDRCYSRHAQLRYSVFDIRCLRTLPLLHQHRCTTYNQPLARNVGNHNTDVRVVESQAELIDCQDTIRGDK